MIRITLLLHSIFLLGFVNSEQISQIQEHPRNNLLINHPYYPVWTNFKLKHAKSYKTKDEELLRFQVFASNHKVIEQHNIEYEAGQHSFALSLNKFADMTNAEFRQRMNGFKLPAKRKLAKSQPLKEDGMIFEMPDNVTIPDSVDWRKEGYVTKVKDQGSCGSCWAFSATGSLEGQHYKQTGKLVSLSEQNLVDCDVNGDDEGCNGGYMDGAFQYVETNKGIDTEASYPYKGRDGRCRFKSEDVGATDTGFVDIPEGNETLLEAAIATVGPVSVAIDAASFKFQFYSHGVYYDRSCSPEYLDHGVLAVGYNSTKDGKQYYIVKNSWSEDWGDDGYILMSRRKNNNCGIATMASYPFVQQ
uniref:Cathepsin L-like n=1 Tax=Longidorus elongatus TaxID=70231 RepID=Q3ZCX6_9BILA|nr:cathepsin L-like cysteine proteinase [Longidorus elongatus]